MTESASLLGENIRLLGSMLGEVIVEQAGGDVFELEEEIRALAKEGRSGDEAATDRITQIVERLVGDLGKSGHILKAFATYFSLVNLAEEHQRIGVLRQRTEQAFLDDTDLPESIDAAVGQLHREGFSAKKVQNLLEQMLITPVFTAHPTESTRRTTRETMRYLSDQLFALRSEGTLEHQRPQLLDNLKAAVTLLWQSDSSRRRKPTVMDELRNTGLYFFENTLLDVVPRIYEELQQALARYYPDHAWEVPPLLQFGSWIGGDRDGNPFVTNETTEAAIRAHRAPPNNESGRRPPIVVRLARMIPGAPGHAHSAGGGYRRAEDLASIWASSAVVVASSLFGRRRNLLPRTLGGSRRSPLLASPLQEKRDFFGGMKSAVTAWGWAFSISSSSHFGSNVLNNDKLWCFRIFRLLHLFRLMLEWSRSRLMT